MVNFTEVISASFEWTVTMLLRPFQVKKWIILGFCALLAGALTSGGFNFNIPRFSGDSGQEEAYLPSPGGITAFDGDDFVREEEFEEVRQKIRGAFERARLKSYFPFMFIALGVLGIGLYILLTWVCCRFVFIFLQNVITNGASIKGPWRRNKLQGNSFFLFNLIVMLTGLLSGGLLVWRCIVSLSVLGVFEKGADAGFFAIAGVVIPYALLLILILLAAMFLWFMLIDFAVPVMFKSRVGTREGLAGAFGMLKRHTADILVFMLIKTGLGFGAIIASGIVNLLAVMGLILPLGILAVLAAGGMKALPGGIPDVALIFPAVLIGLPVLAAVNMFLICLQLPFAVFFRALSVNFLGQIEPGYNLFIYESGEK